MRVCEGCGKKHSPTHNFCTGCGRVLPVEKRTSGNNPFADIFARSDVGGPIAGESAGSNTSAAPKEPNHAEENRSQSRSAGRDDPIFSAFGRFMRGRGPAQGAETTQNDPNRRAGTGHQSQRENVAPPSKTAALKSVAAAAIKAGTKSLALSAAVLGPGFLLLLSGAQVAGMIWLFFGSFGLMSWTYRKPWRLGWISCLIPPIVALCCYLAQLAIFQQSPPFLWVVAAVAAGSAIGYFRGQAHEVYEEDQSIFAQRTIQYLLVWVVAYGATQAIAMTSTNVLAIRGGLVTGALTTAMLLVVSVMLIRRWRSFATAAVLVLGMASQVFDPNAANAMADDHTDVNRYLTQIVSDRIRSLQHPNFPCRPEIFRNSFSRNPQEPKVEVDVRARCGGTKREGESFTANNKIFIDVRVWPGDRKNFVITRDMTRSRVRNEGSKREHSSRTRRWRTTRQDISNSRYRAYLDDSITHDQNWDRRRRIPIDVIDDMTAKIEAESIGEFNLPGAHGWSISTFRIRVTVDLRDQQGLPGPVPVNEFVRQIYGDVSGGLTQIFGNGSPRGSLSSSSASRSPPSSATGSFPSTGRSSTGSGGGGGTGAVSPEEAAAAAAALAAALIAAGVAVNVAQAVAAAVAQALQAGVQLTADEIQAAISEALLGSRSETQPPGSPEQRDKPPPDSGSLYGTSNSPPNVQTSERVRPPSPVRGPCGKPFPTNDDGEYLAPDKDGNLVWMNRQDARDAAEALRREQARRDAEQDRFEEDARRERETWWNRKQEEKETADRDRLRRETEEREKETAEEQRRDNLETVIMNTLQADPGRGDYNELMARLAAASQDDDSRELENIWYDLIGDRQRQLDEMARERAEREQEAQTAKTREDIAVLVRDRGKNAAQAGLALTSGGGITLAQAGVFALSNIGNSAAQTGLTATGEGVQFDGWQATRGAVRGGVDSLNSVVGGVATNGRAGVAIGKTVFSTTSTYGRTFADTFDKTGDRDLSHSRAGMAAMAEAGKSAGGEFIDERMRQSGLAAQRQTMDPPSAARDVTDPNWLNQHADSLQQMNRIRGDAGKTAVNVLGNSLGNIASADRDKDAETGVAVWNAVKTEAEGQTWSRIANAGAKSPEPTPEQQAVIDRLQAERMGTAPRPEITPDYADYLRSRGISLEDYSPGPEHTEAGGGFNQAAQRHAQRVADNIGGQVLSRTVESEGQQAIANDQAVPKGPDMKGNSGRSIDTVIGMDPGNINRVVVFEPKMPSEEAFTEYLGRPPKDSDWQQLEARRQKRQDQFDYYNGKLGKDDFPYHREDGGQRVIHSGSGLPIAGDMDVFDYRGLYGEPLPRAVQEEAARQHMRNPNMTGQNIASTVEHGAHMMWDIDGLDNTQRGPDGKTDYERARETKVGIIDQVRPGGDGGPLAVWSARPGLTTGQVGSSHYTGSGSGD